VPKRPFWGAAGVEIVSFISRLYVTRHLPQTCCLLTVSPREIGGDGLFQLLHQNIAEAGQARRRQYPEPISKANLALNEISAFIKRARASTMPARPLRQLLLRAILAMRGPEVTIKSAFGGNAFP